ncbi:MAG: HAMP domain-containing histidine kinase [Bacteroidetes bacterium]|nr:HAMP domain-containing histidine kinase [Bacteroidota bacterium]
MKKATNSKSIGLLMLISQLLLTVFVLQWLFAQYHDERELLKKELAQQFSDSKQQVVDSMLLKTFIGPLLRDKKNPNIHIDIDKNTTLPCEAFAEQNIQHNILPNGKAIIKKITTVSSNSKKIDSSGDYTKRDINKIIVLGADSTVLYDTIHDKLDRKIRMKFSSASKEDMLLHGINFIYKMISSLSKDSNGLKRKFDYKIDTVLFKKILSDHLEKNGLNVPAKWITAADTSESKNSVLYFESAFFPVPYGVEISGYNFYLFKKIVPQVLFALILLLLTGAAFVFAYRNMKAQGRLHILRNDFISNISHELKTPVSTVKVVIEALQNFDMKNDPKVSAEYLEMASLEMNRLDLLIDKVLNTSLLENENLITTEITDVKPVLANLLRSLQPRFNQNSANVKLIAKDEVFNANIDKFHVEGVLTNLLDNSLKYAGEKTEIKIVLEQDEKEVIIVVSDNGPGIPYEYLDKVFEKFFRVPNGNQHNVKGYGLGLSYASLVMQQHKGSIRVKNRAEGGCEFKLHFPKAEP